MCEGCDKAGATEATFKTVSVSEAVGSVLAHDITEIRPGEFKGRAFKKGHRIRHEDIFHLLRLGKDCLFVLEIAEDELHEDDAARLIARALRGEGVALRGEPKEGKIEILADRDGLLKIHREALLKFNLLGEAMCATLHDNTRVQKGQTVAGTRAIPLVVKKTVVEQAIRIAEEARQMSPSGGTMQGGLAIEVRQSFPRTGVIEVRKIRKPRAGIVITGNEIYYGRIQDAFAPILSKKIEYYGGEIIGIQYAPDDARLIEERLRALLRAGADLLLATGGMSVDPDDVTRQAIRRLGAADITYGSAVLPGAMVLVGTLPATLVETEVLRRESEKGPNAKNGERIGHLTEVQSAVSILGIPACAMYHETTVIDLILPRILAGEKIGRRELAELGHGGMCLQCRPLSVPGVPVRKVRGGPTSSKLQIATPANRKLGEEVIIPPPGSCGSAKERVEKAGQEYNCLDSFLCLKKCPHG